MRGTGVGRKGRVSVRIKYHEKDRVTSLDKHGGVPDTAKANRREKRRSHVFGLGQEDVGFGLKMGECNCISN